MFPQLERLYLSDSNRVELAPDQKISAPYPADVGDSSGDYYLTDRYIDTRVGLEVAKYHHVDYQKAWWRSPACIGDERGMGIGMSDWVEIPVYFLDVLLKDKSVFIAVDTNYPIKK